STLTGAVGTPAFMAPEQVEGTAGGAPLDMFAWGCTMAFAANGVPPFGGDSVPAIMRRVLHEEPDLGALAGELRELVAACLAKEPRSRPTAVEVLRRLLGAEAGANLLAEGSSAATLTSPPATTPLGGLDPRAPSAGRRGGTPAATGAVSGAVSGAARPWAGPGVPPARTAAARVSGGSARTAPGRTAAPGRRRGLGRGPAHGRRDRRRGPAEGRRPRGRRAAGGGLVAHRLVRRLACGRRPGMLLRAHRRGQGRGHPADRLARPPGQRHHHDEPRHPEPGTG